MTRTPSARSGDGDAPNGGSDPSAPGGAERIGSLRGASVQFDLRRAGQVAVGLVAATLLVLVVVLTVAGVHSNNQIDTLHGRGVPVTVTVSGCLGLLGGSGSNAAGYSCHGSYTLDGRRYTEPLPGTSFHAPGSTIAAVAVSGDPALLSPDNIIENQHSSAGVYVVPAVLAGVLVVLLGLIVWRYRTVRRDEAHQADPTT
jgi:hypothetical protein